KERRRRQVRGLAAPPVGPGDFVRARVVLVEPLVGSFAQHELVLAPVQRHRCGRPRGLPPVATGIVSHAGWILRTRLLPVRTPRSRPRSGRFETPWPRTPGGPGWWRGRGGHRNSGPR